MSTAMNMATLSELQPFRLRIEDYELLDRTGVFEGRRTELIEGVVVAVSPEMSPHTLLKNELMFRFRLALRALKSSYDAYVEPSLSLPPHNMPAPDVLISLASARRKYFGLEDTALVIEVGASSIRTDLGVKLRMYAAQGVAEYWVVGVRRSEVHQFWNLRDGAYTETRIVPLAGELRSATMPDLAIDGSGIL